MRSSAGLTSFRFSLWIIGTSTAKHELSRQIMQFHKLRHLSLRYGRRLTSAQGRDFRLQVSPWPSAARPLIQAADGDARALSADFLRCGQPDPVHGSRRIIVCTNRRIYEHQGHGDCSECAKRHSCHRCHNACTDLSKIFTHGILPIFQGG
jgi:hypothetical protein